MNIQVCYPDNRIEYVNESILNRLIETKKIIKFRRSSGWVTVGVDPVRDRDESSDSSWRDRKKPIEANSCDAR